MVLKEIHMIDKYMRTDSTRCDHSHITLDLQSQVIQLGSQLEESFLTHLSIIWFSLRILISNLTLLTYTTLLKQSNLIYIYLLHITATTDNHYYDPIIVTYNYIAYGYAIGLL